MGVRTRAPRRDHGTRKARIYFPGDPPGQRRRGCVSNINRLRGGLCLPAGAVDGGITDLVLSSGYRFGGAHGGFDLIGDPVHFGGDFFFHPLQFLVLGAKGDIFGVTHLGYLLHRFSEMVLISNNAVKMFSAVLR